MSSHSWETSSSFPAPAAEQPWRIKPVLPVTKLLGAVAVLVLVLAFGREDPIAVGAGDGGRRSGWRSGRCAT